MCVVMASRAKVIKITVSNNFTATLRELCTYVFFLTEEDKLNFSAIFRICSDKKILISLSCFFLST